MRGARSGDEPGEEIVCPLGGGLRLKGSVSSVSVTDETDVHEDDDDSPTLCPPWDASGAGVGRGGECGSVALSLTMYAAGLAGRN